MALREKDVERRAKLADEQLAKAEKMMQEYKNTVAAGRTTFLVKVGYTKFWSINQDKRT